MPKKELKIEVSLDIFTALNESESDLLNDMKLFTAINYYQNDKLSLGKAAQFAGLSKYDFENILSKHEITISKLNVDDIKADLQKLAKL